MNGLDDFLTSGLNSISQTMDNPSLNIPMDSMSFSPQGLSFPGTGYVDPQGNPVDPSASTEVEPLVLTAPPRPQPNSPPLNYDNTKDIQAVQQSLRNAPRVDGGTDRGLWGMLPHQVSHGTLRDVLGSVGDAFLMANRQAPIYTDRVNQRTLGQAMAGYANNPQAAIERVAATGAPGSAEMADKMEQNYQNLQIRQQIAQQNNDYRRAMEQSRQDAIIARMTPQVAGWAQSPNIRTKADYQNVYDRADAAAKRINPNASAADFGYVDPEDWTPDAMAGVGATTGQQMRDATSRASIAERANASNVAHLDRRASIAAHPTQITGAQMVQNAFDDVRANGANARPESQQIIQRYLHGTKGGASGLHATTTGGAPAQQQGGGQRYSPAQARALPKGTKFQGQDGNWYIR